MTDDWKVVYKALYKEKKIGKDGLKKVKKLHLSNEERIQICGE